MVLSQNIIQDTRPIETRKIFTVLVEMDSTFGGSVLYVLDIEVVLGY